MSTNDAPNILLDQLAQEEQLLWVGKPNPDIYYIARRKEAIRFSLVVILFFGSLGFISWAFDGLGSRSITCFVLGCIFSLIGFVSSKEQFAPKWWYLVTDQRLLTNYPTDSPERFTELLLTRIKNMRIVKHTQSSGTIQFNFSPFRQNCIPFECIDDVENVHKAIENARAVLLSNPATHTINERDFLSS